MKTNKNRQINPNFIPFVHLDAIRSTLNKEVNKKVQNQSQFEDFYKYNLMSRQDANSVNKRTTTESTEMNEEVNQSGQHTNFNLMKQKNQKKIQYQINQRKQQYYLDDKLENIALENGVAQRERDRTNSPSMNNNFIQDNKRQANSLFSRRNQDKKIIIYELPEINNTKGIIQNSPDQQYTIKKPVTLAYVQPQAQLKNICNNSSISPMKERERGVSLNNQPVTQQSIENSKQLIHDIINNKVQKTNVQNSPNNKQQYQESYPRNNRRSRSCMNQTEQDTINQKNDDTYEFQKPQLDQLYDKNLADLRSTSKPLQNNVVTKVISRINNPQAHWELNDEEWKKFADRFPKNYEKLKLLGRGGFSLVWLGKHTQTNDIYAIKQICSKNTYNIHLKEIWFCSLFFINGQIKPQYINQRGVNNLARMIQFDVGSQDTWIFYELCGSSLGNSLYDLQLIRGQVKERVYKINQKPLYLAMQKDQKILKKILTEVSQVLVLFSDNNLVHSDIKPENILIKTENNRVIQTKLIDYGSCFQFKPQDFQNFTNATPEYMAPEILNYILFKNDHDYYPELLTLLQNYNKPHPIDIWSLGCVALEIVYGIPVWMSFNTIIKRNGQQCTDTGLFAVKGRVFKQIIRRQIEVVTNLDKIFENKNYSGLCIDETLKKAIKSMLQIKPEKRISPQDLCKLLETEPNKVFNQQFIQ